VLAGDAGVSSVPVLHPLDGRRHAGGCGRSVAGDVHLAIEGAIAGGRQRSLAAAGACMSEPSASSPATSHGHEQRDVSFRPIVAAGGGFLPIPTLLFLVWGGVFDYFARRQAVLSPPANPLAGTYGRQLPPEPRLQTAPIQDLRQLRAAEDALLGTYGWSDEQHATMRIPIARAMELLAQRGLPARAEGEGKQ